MYIYIWHAYSQFVQFALSSSKRISRQSSREVIKGCWAHIMAYMKEKQKGGHVYEDGNRLREEHNVENQKREQEAILTSWF